MDEWDKIRIMNSLPGYVKFNELYKGMILYKNIDDNARDLCEEDNEKTCMITKVTTYTFKDMFDKEHTIPEYHVKFDETNRETIVQL